jgi:hypothetical protein
MTIRIDVERLVLDGIELDAHGAEALRAAVGAELARLFQAHHVANFHSGAVPVLRAPVVHLEPDASAARMGSQVAGAVYGSIGR